MPTDADPERIVQLVEAGWTFEAIGQEVGCSTATAWRVARRKAPGLRKKRTYLTDEEREGIRALHAADFSTRATARIVKRSYETVRTVLRRSGLAVKVKPWRCPGCRQRITTDRCLLCDLDAKPGQTNQTKEQATDRGPAFV